MPLSHATRVTIVERVIVREGGTSDHDNDRGGLTRYGLTRPFLEDVTARTWSDDEIHVIDRSAAVSLYVLWLSLRRLDQLPDHLGVADAVIDYAVHSGARSAIKATQLAIGIRVDGIAGPETQGAWGLVESDPVQCEALRWAVMADRLRRLGRILGSDPSQRVFARGWLNRMADLVVL